ncbi:PASTA domain-containing protein [Candidatus Margulisiibacteriota bacterium]
MLVKYLSFYFVFLIFASLIISLLVLKLKLPSPQIVIPVIIAVIISPLLIGYLYITYFTSIPEVRVPDLKGVSSEEAISRLEILRLKGRFAGTIYNMNYPEGVVASQRPEGGRKVKTGRTVILLTSSGTRKVLVPNLLGRSAEQAKAVLAAKGLLLGQVSRDFVEGLDPGVVLSQTLLPEEEVDAGTAVKITVSASAEVAAEKPKKQEGKSEKKEEEGGFRLW